jgi:hypothetical protein
MVQFPACTGTESVNCCNLPIKSPEPFVHISCPGLPLALGKCINPRICFMPEQEKVEDPTEEYHDDSHTHTFIKFAEENTTKTS